MNLSIATNVAQQALATVSAESATVSRNIDGVNVPGFSLKNANVISTFDGGSEVVSVTNAQNQALFGNVLSATSASASQTALSNGITSLTNTIGEPGSDTSPAEKLNDLVDALQQYENSPSTPSLATAAVTAAQNLASSLNTATTTVQQVREQADQGMAASVSTINSLMSQFQAVNQQIVTGTAAGTDVTDLEDSRNEILTQLSQQIGVTTSTSANGEMSVYTDSGVPLDQNGTVSSVTFQPTTTYTAGTTGNAVYIDGIPVTGSSSAMPIQSGTLAGLATLRDDTTVTYQAQLDETANGLINAFAETNPSDSTDTLAGLFTNGTSTALPTSTQMTGLAGTITVNAAVVASEGGSAENLANGINFNFNTADAGSFTTQLSQYMTNLSATQSFSGAGQIGTSDTLAGYTAASVSWLNNEQQQVSTESAFQSTLLSTSTTALSNATGVNLDSEMSQMLDLENSYSASAKLLTTISDMFTDLADAVDQATTA